MATALTIDLEKVRGNANAKLIIDGFQNLNKDPNWSTLLSGYVTSNTSLQMGSDYSSPSNAIGGGASTFLNIAGKQVNRFEGASIGGNTVAGGITQVQLTSVFSTIQNWQGAQLFGFTLPTVFIALREADNPLEDVHKLLQAVMPTYDSFNVDVLGAKNVDLAGKMNAPNNYSPGNLKEGGTRGTFSLQIGQWFKALDSPFLIKDVSFEISKEVIASGAPLYVLANITFQTYRSYSVVDVRQWIQHTIGAS